MGWIDLIFEEKERVDEETRREIALHSDMTSLDECE